MARHRSRRHRMRGGGGAADYAMSVSGTADAQYMRTFTAPIPGNTIVGVQGQNSTFVGAPTSEQLNLAQNGGRRRRRGSKRGGFMGEMINQAVVPMAILGMQQTYRRRRGGARRTRRYRRR